MLGSAAGYSTTMHFLQIWIPQKLCNTNFTIVTTRWLTKSKKSFRIEKPVIQVVAKTYFDEICFILSLILFKFIVNSWDTKVPNKETTLSMLLQTHTERCQCKSKSGPAIRCSVLCISTSYRVLVKHTYIIRIEGSSKV